VNPFVKKEIRLLLPSWIAAMVLALLPACVRSTDFYIWTRDDDAIPLFLLFFGMATMALVSIGRECSLNTFSQLLSQPVERMRIWQTKLSVLAVAFLLVVGAWRLATIFSFPDYGENTTDPDISETVLVAGWLVVVATFSGGLWATLLLRQIAGAFWLTLLVPATLSGFTAAFLSESQSDSGVIAALCVILGIYSVGGFLFARWLFFRAQDVGWTGGIISLPEWKFFSTRSETAGEIRNRKPIFTLLKKEFQLQQVSLMGATGLLVLHIGVIVLRTHHKFTRDSAGEILTSIFWILWLVLPVLVGAMSVAEERRLGVMEGQLCLPASRRVQFIIKGLVTLFLGIFLGGVMPCLLEGITASSSMRNPIFDPAQRAGDLVVLPLAIVVLSAWLVLVSFFASSLAKNFLQAVGFAIATFIGSAMVFPAFAKGRMIFFDSIPMGSALPLLIAAPVLIFALLLLAYLNFKNFRDGWHLWQRNLLGLASVIIFIIASSMTLYNRAWEIFQPTEPAHGGAKLSLANPPALHLVQDYNLLVRLPDGHVWFDYLDNFYYGYDDEHIKLKYLYRMLFHPLPESGGPRQFVAGSNWVAATTQRLYFGWNDSGKHFYSSGNFDTVGIQPDGTLWVSGNSEQNKWETGILQQFGSETNWQQLAQSRTSVVLLKTDGTLWRWGSTSNELHQWPGLRAFKPYQIGTNSDWRELFTLGGIFARQEDGRVWNLNVDWKTGKDELSRATNYDAIVSKTASRGGDQQVAFVRAGGTLWVLNRHWGEKGWQMEGTGVLQVGKETNWQAVAVSHQMMVALKTDGSLWQWNFQNWSATEAVNVPPTRLGIHDDWVAIASTWNNVIALAADGSLWLWPDKKSYDYGILMKLPKQPQLLGQLFSDNH
jgi:hypothetical protein